MNLKRDGFETERDNIYSDLTEKNGRNFLSGLKVKGRPVSYIFSICLSSPYNVIV